MKRKSLFSDRIKILIVDDDKTMRVFLEEVLVNAGYITLVASGATEAFSLANKQLPDIILMDVVMPGENGFDICKKLKKQEKTRKIPIIFLTVRQNVTDKYEGFLSGGVDYLTKPFNSEELLIRIKKHVEMYWLRCLLEQMLDAKSKKMGALQYNLNKANEFLIEHNYPYKKVLSVLEAGILEIDRKGACLYSDESAACLLGYASPEELLGKIVYKSNNEFRRRTDILFFDGNIDNNSYLPDVNLLKKNGGELCVELRMEPVCQGDVVVRTRINFTDIGARKSIESNLFTLSNKDPLTGLANRTVFMEVLKREIYLYKSNNKNLALLIIDLDRFKEINDSLGHLVGDQILCEVAKRLDQSVREKGRIARLGGDEYSFITDGFDSQKDLLSLANRISKRLSEPYELSFSWVSLTASIGLAVFNDGSKNAEDLMTYADWALYKAKKSRNGDVCIFEADMLVDLEYEIEIARELSKVMAKNQLIVEYQPQFDIHHNTYVGAEALIRWNHPEKGCLLPLKFLPIAEKRGFIKDISYYTVRAACEQIRLWKDDKINFGVISINICAQQLNEDDFFESIVTILNKNQVSPHEVVFEFTETTLINIRPNTKKALTELTNLGVKFAIDDFGTGFSSMHLLKSVHCDKLKIDKEFVDGIHVDEKCTVIIKSLIDLAKKLKMVVIAEGVETKKQLDFLVENGCDIAQGFYFNKSLSPQELENTIFNSGVKA